MNWLTWVHPTVQRQVTSKRTGGQGKQAMASHPLCLLSQLPLLFLPS